MPTHPPIPERRKENIRATIMGKLWNSATFNSAEPVAEGYRVRFLGDFFLTESEMQVFVEMTEGRSAPSSS